MEPNAVACFLQQPDSERARSSSRNGSTSKRPVISSSRPSSSGEPSESRSSRLVSSSGRLSTAQRIQPGYDSKTSFTRTAAARGGRDDTLRSFELLSIGTGKRKWNLIHLIKCLCQDSFCSIYQRCQHDSGFTRVTLYMCIHCWVHSQLKSSMKFHLRTIPLSPSSWILAILMHRRLTQERDLTVSLQGVVYIFEILVAVINTSFMIFLH